MVANVHVLVDTLRECQHKGRNYRLLIGHDRGNCFKLSLPSRAKLLTSEWLSDRLVTQRIERQKRACNLLGHL